MTRIDLNERAGPDGRSEEFTEIARVEPVAQSFAGIWSGDDRYVAIGAGQRVYVWPQADINGLKARIVERIADRN